MSLIKPPPQPTSDDMFWKQIRWPIVVVALLAGHITVMMVGLVSALTIPGAIDTTPAYQQYEASITVEASKLPEASLETK